MRKKRGKEEKVKWVKDDVMRLFRVLHLGCEGKGADEGNGLSYLMI